jgi:hypothetical protein
MEALQALEASRANYEAYGEINPDNVFEQYLDEKTGQMTYISVKELVDKVKVNILVHELRQENPMIRIRTR